MAVGVSESVVPAAIEPTAPPLFAPPALGCVTVLPLAVDASSGTRLIAGLPTKLATNMFTGWAKTCAGVSYCCR